MYNEKVMKIFANPKNAGTLRGANGIGKVGNAACGDIMKIFLKIEDGIIVDAKFRTFGCAAAIVSSSVACELIKGMTVEQALGVTNRQICEEIGQLPSHKIHCSVLAEEGIAAAIKYYRRRMGLLEKKEKKQEAVKPRTLPAAKQEFDTKARDFSFTPVAETEKAEFAPAKQEESAPAAPVAKTSNFALELEAEEPLVVDLAYEAELLYAKQESYESKSSKATKTTTTTTTTTTKKINNE